MKESLNPPGRVDTEPSGTILLLMDHKANQNLLIQVLETRYQVMTRQNGSREEVVACAPFDLLVLDGSRPGDLLDRVHRRKAREHPAFLPVLLILPHQSPKGQSEGLMKAFDGLIYPPIRKADLITRVGALIRTRMMSLELMASNRHLEAVNADLRKAMEEIRTLRGILPICSYCKKIRDDQGYWNQIEDYIRGHSEAEFSHGICQDCARLYYPDYDLYDE